MLDVRGLLLAAHGGELPREEVDGLGESLVDLVGGTDASELPVRARSADRAFMSARTPMLCMVELSLHDGRARKGWCRRVRRGLRFYPDVEAREPDPMLYLVGLIARNG